MNLQKILSKERKIHVKRFQDKDLSGCCAIVSYNLFETLKRNNIKTTLAIATFEEFGHCFLQFEDKILDVTATQFSSRIPEVLIIDKEKYIPFLIKNSIYNFDLESIETFKNKKKFRKRLIELQWPKFQIP